MGPLLEVIYRMRRKLGKSEVIALLAAAGVTTCAAAQAAKVDNTTKSGTQSLQVSEQQSRTELGKDMACGKGSCGTDESGAKAAADKHAKAEKVVKKAAEKKVEKKVAEKKSAENKEASGDKKSK
jgi:hypothetical protein